MTQEQTDYIKNRVKDQINWFDKKSIVNKRLHYTMASVSAFGAILSASSLLTSCAILTALLSLLVAIAIACDNLFRFREKWLIYRLANENLKSLLAKYYAFGGLDWNSFVTEVEAVLERANGDWQKLIVQKDN